MKKIEKMTAARKAERIRNIIYPIYCDGLEAAKEGKPRSSNPYYDKAGKKAEYENWNHGWLAGMGKICLDSEYEPITDFRFELYDG